MIERQRVNGRMATVAYFGDNFVPMNKATAPYAKVIYDDGQMLILKRNLPLTPVEKRAAKIEKRLMSMRELVQKYNHEHDERGRFAERGGGAPVKEGGDVTGLTANGHLHVAEKDMAEIKQKLDAGDLEGAESHPVLEKIRKIAESLPKTDQELGYMGPNWLANRQFTDGVVGYKAAADKLTEHAMSYSDGPVRQEREAVIFLGPPASGKSSFAERLAADMKAAIVDPDDAKKMFKEYRGGIGAEAVHEESSALSGWVLYNTIVNGSNVIIPKVGASPDKIDKLAKTLKAFNYRVHLVNMDVPTDEAKTRALNRFLRPPHRLISKKYTEAVDGNPSKTYDLLKNNGDYAEKVNIDNGQKQWGHHAITEGHETRIGRILAGPGRKRH